jgi:hypothetical protein
MNCHEPIVGAAVADPIAALALGGDVALLGLILSGIAPRLSREDGRAAISADTE